jgi:hypothetical protein
MSLAGPPVAALPEHNQHSLPKLHAEQPPGALHPAVVSESMPMPVSVSVSPGDAAEELAASASSVSGQVSESVHNSTGPASAAIPDVSAVANDSAAAAAAAAAALDSPGSSVGAAPVEEGNAFIAQAQEGMSGVDPHPTGAVRDQLGDFTQAFNQETEEKSPFNMLSGGLGNPTFDTVPLPLRESAAAAADTAAALGNAKPTTLPPITKPPLPSVGLSQTLPVPDPSALTNLLEEPPQDFTGGGTFDARSSFKHLANAATATASSAAARTPSPYSPYGASPAPKSGDTQRKQYGYGSSGYTGGSAFAQAVDATMHKKQNSKIRIGRYIIGNDVLHVKKYVFIPSACLESPAFSFEEVFDKIKLDRPTTLFRILQAKDSEHWNVKLPPSRLHLAHRPAAVAAPKKNTSSLPHILPFGTGPSFGNVSRIFPGGGDIEEAGEAHHDHEDDNNSNANANDNDNSIGRKSFSGMEASLGAEADDIVDGHAGTSPSAAEGAQDGNKVDLTLPVHHYKAVLRENSKRFLKESCRALVEVGACVRMNASWVSRLAG